MLEPGVALNPTVAPASGAPSSAVLSVGEVVAERYRIDAVLGEGGMGVVYRAEHLHLHKPHALKVLLAEWSSSPDIVARFEREAIAAGNIQSPNVAAATDFGRLPDGSFFLVMEYVNGRTLRSALEEAPFEPARALRIMTGIASALHAAHAVGIVHRDIKPENIMLIERDGDPDFVKVLDFGIAKLQAGVGAGQERTAQPLTQAGTVIGTPDYMSPEQALGQPVDARSDLYSVGVILYEMLVGQVPFTGDAITMLRQRIIGDVPELPTTVAGHVHPRVANLLRCLLAKVPENRVANAAELLVDIEDCMGVAHPVSHVQPVQPAAQVTPAPVRSSLESVPGMTTPVSQRVRRTVLAAAKRIESVARRSLEDPRVLLEYATRRNLVIAAIGVAVLVVSIIVTVAGGGTTEPRKATAGVPSGSLSGEDEPSPSSSAQRPQSVDDMPFLPPPPAPSSTTTPAAKPSASQSPSRRTGPGGIYVPPPSQWFK
jgi:serine/threonine-protein kinase